MRSFKLVVFLSAIALGLFVLDYAILKDTKDRQLVFQPAPAAVSAPAPAERTVNTSGALPQKGDTMTIAFTDDRVMVAIVDRTILRHGNFVAASVLLGYNPAVLPSDDPVKARVISVVVDCAGGQYIVAGKYLLGENGVFLREDQSAKDHGYEKIKPNTAMDKAAELLCNKPAGQPTQALTAPDGRQTI